MTQPIQEPGQTTRTDAKLTWGSNQLFRRPAPDTDPYVPDVPFCRLWNSSTDFHTISSGDDPQAMQMENAYNPFPVYFDVEDPGDFYTTIFVLIPGIYIVKLAFRPDFENVDFQATFTGSGNVPGGIKSMMFSDGSLGQILGWEWTTHIDTGVGMGIIGFVQQESGSDQDIYQGLIEAIFLGPSSGQPIPTGGGTVIR